MGQERRGRPGWDSWMASQDSMDVSLSGELRNCGDGQGGLASAIHGVRVGPDWAEWDEHWTEQIQQLPYIVYFNLTSNSKRYIKGKKHGEDKTFSNRKTKQGNNYISLENLRMDYLCWKWIFTIMFPQKWWLLNYLQHL